jgi:cytochrome oxidase Cu insertion factor (SCO1/SenC/PrrC family)
VDVGDARVVGGVQPDGYDVQHTAITYLPSPAARPARYWPDTESATSIAADLSRLLAGPAPREQ